MRTGRAAEDVGPVVPGWGPWWLRAALVVVAGLYLFVLALANTGSNISKGLPAVPRYFTQVACLFPRAALMGIEYRVEGWSCDQQAWVPLDHRPDFPLHSDHKESRFHRLGSFYRRELPVMQALDAYLVRRNAARGVRIGGIRYSSLRIPLPPVGGAIERYRWKPLDAFPAEYRKGWYETGRINRTARCAPETP